MIYELDNKNFMNKKKILKLSKSKYYDKKTNDETIIDPFYWGQALGKNDIRYITADKYKYVLPELDNYINQKITEVGDDGKSISHRLSEQTKNLIEFHKTNKNFRDKFEYKISKQKSWESEEVKLRLSCEFFKIQYVPPNPFEIKVTEFVYNKKTNDFEDKDKKYKLPLKWRWPNTAEQRNTNKPEWYSRWEKWLSNDYIRRKGLKIEKIKKQIMNGKIKEQWDLFSAEEVDSIIHVKEESDKKYYMKKQIPKRIEVIDESEGFAIGSTGSIAFGPNEEYKTKGAAMRALKEFQQDI